MGGQSEPTPDIWTTVPGVAGSATVVALGDVIMLHTHDQPARLQELFARTHGGRPTELTKSQAIELAQLLLRAAGVE